MSQQGLRQAAFRTYHGGSGGTYEQDLLAAFAVDSITTGSFNERFLAWINAKLSTSHTNLTAALQDYAITKSATPVWAAEGTVTTSTTLPGNYTVAVPAHSAGDLLILQCLCRNVETNGTLASIDTAGWTQFGGAGNMYGGAQIARIGGGWKIGNGTETGVDITVTGGTTTDLLVARVHRITSLYGFAASPVQNIGTALTGTGTTLTAGSVTGGGHNRLAASLVAVGTSTSIAAPTGETGGDWTRPAGTPGGSNGTQTLFSAAINTTGNISGGTSTITSGNWASVSFVIVPNPSGATNWSSLGSFTV